MSKNYRSGFERLADYAPEKAERYAIALREVRKAFTGFGEADGYSTRRALTPAQEKQVRRYYNLLRAYVERGPVYVMSPSELPASIMKGGRKNVEAVMRAAQMHTGRKRAKKIFIQYDGEVLPTVSVRGGVPVFVNKRIGYAKEIVELSKEGLAIDARQTILSIKEILPERPLFYTVTNHQTDFYKGKSAAAELETLANYVEELQAKYKIGGPDSWDRWLTGVAVYYALDTGTSLSKVREHISKARAAYKKKHKKKRRK